MNSQWPSAVREDGTSPVSLELMASGSIALVRQAVYQMHAAVMLQDSGHEIRSFQAPLIGRRTRITIPIVIAHSPGADVCAYTEAENWDDARIDVLQEWLRQLREETDADVLVVSRTGCDRLSLLADISECIHFPYEKLPLVT